METLDSAQQPANQIIAALGEVPKEFARIVWSIISKVLVKSWPWLLSLILVGLIVAVTKALMGRWGMLGSILYNLFYFGILLVVVLIWGPEVFVSNAFAAISAVVFYPISYVLTGMVLDKLGVRGRR